MIFSIKVVFCVHIIRTLRNLNIYERRFIDKEEQNEENIPTPENGHLDYKPADTKKQG